MSHSLRCAGIDYTRALDGLLALPAMLLARAGELLPAGLLRIGLHAGAATRRRAYRSGCSLWAGWEM